MYNLHKGKITGATNDVLHKLSIERYVCTWHNVCHAYRLHRIKSLSGSHKAGLRQQMCMSNATVERTQQQSQALEISPASIQ